MSEEQKLTVEEQLQKISNQLDRIADILTIVFNGPLNFYNNTVKLAHERDAYQKAYLDLQNKQVKEVEENTSSK